MSHPSHLRSEALFITVAAMTMSSVALCIDTILPALNNIAAEFKLSDENTIQWTLTMVFIGLGLGQIPIGIWSDHVGRKIPILVSLIVLVISSIASIFVQSYEALLITRLIQGLAASGPRLLIVAVVRDLYSGPDMARMMSLIFMVFIGVPMIAPILGQWILFLGSWHLIFVFFAIFFSLNIVLVQRILPETLADERRRPLGFTHVVHSFREVLKQKTTMLNLLAISTIFGSFSSYLITAQLILQNTYKTNELFVYYFGAIAFIFGVANYTNSKLVQKIDLRTLNVSCLIIVIISSLAMLLFSVLYAGLPPIWAFIIWCIFIFMPTAMLFSNMNAIAMLPLGHVAGMGSAIIGTATTLISAVIGAYIGSLYAGNLYPIIGGFLLCNLIALVFVVLERRSVKQLSE